MVPGSKCVFIVGFERCSTTSLANWLVNSGHCDLMVDGIKEPAVFRSQPDLATKIIERRAKRPGWALDGSVCYIHSAEALEAIRDTVEDHRIIVSMRHQIERTVSAFKLYKARYTLPAAAILDPVDNYTFGTPEVRARLAQDPLAPAYFSHPIVGRYVFTCLYASEHALPHDHPDVARCDEAVSVFAEQGLRERVLYEVRYAERTQRLPVINILGSSYYSGGVGRVLSTFDRSRVTFVSPAQEFSRTALSRKLRNWLGTPTRNIPFPMSYQSDRFGVSVSEKEISFVEEIIGASLTEDAEHTAKLISGA